MLHKIEYVLRRLLTSLFVLFGVSIITFSWRVWYRTTRQCSTLAQRLVRRIWRVSGNN